jgi:dihydrodipicolinate synthase/N-acetylneuraminate lyase
MSDGNGWRGAFPIPMTPYDEKDRIDEDVLTAEIEFCIESGVGGIATPLMVSEFRNLSEAERKLMIKVPVKVAAGRVPIVANCAATNTPLAVEYARYAQEVGAEAVIAMPPYIRKPDFVSLRAYYQAISDAVEVPVWIQNAGVAALSPHQIAQLCTEIEHVSWVKEEVPPSHKSISGLVAENCPAIKGIMGGGAGRPMMTEQARGSKGVMHACQFCDLVQKTWEFLDNGEMDKAGDLFEILLPGLMVEGLMGMAFAKEIMIRRGVFKNHVVRGQYQPLDQDDMKEIDRIWERIEPHLIWHK